MGYPIINWPEMLRHAEDWADGFLGRSYQRFADVDRRNRVRAAGSRHLESASTRVKAISLPRNSCTLAAKIGREGRDVRARFQRRLTTILAADIAEYSRLTRDDEDGTLTALTACRAVVDGLIAEHRGRIANTAGDSVLAEFPSVAEGLSCALAIQEAIAKQNEPVSPDRQMRFRIGLHLGDVMSKSGDLLGRCGQYRSAPTGARRAGRHLRFGGSARTCRNPGCGGIHRCAP